MRTIAIINQKGGCGKTTTAINLAGVFARKNKRTLLVDLDPQSHCAAGLAIPEQRIDIQIGDAMAALDPAHDGDAKIEWSKLLWRVARNLDLAPSTVKLAALEAPRGPLASALDAERRLDGVLTRLADQYDICLIDCPPSIGLLTFNALVAADEVLIPVETGFFALQGAAKQVATLKAMAKKIGISPPHRLVATMHDESNSLAREVLEQINDRFRNVVAPVVIRLDPKLREAVQYGQPTIEYAPDSPGAEDYAALADWLLHTPMARRASQRVEASAGRGAAVGAAPLQGGSESVSAHRDEFSPLDRFSTWRNAGDSVESARPAGAAPTEVVHFREQAIAAALAGRPPANTTQGPAVGFEPARAGFSAEFLQMLAAAPFDPAAAQPTFSPSDLAALREAQMGVQPPEATECGGDPEESAAVSTFTETKPQRRQRDRINSLELVDSDDEPNGAVPSDAILALCGARPTAQGVLFVQPVSAARTIAVAGAFNGWSPTAMPLRRNPALGVFEGILLLPPGRHEYRLVIDGVPARDPHNPVSTLSPFGDVLSVVEVSPRS